MLTKKKTIPLKRSGEIIDNIFSAVCGLKETELTACFAYLLSAFPDSLGDLIVERNEKIEEINIEHVAENKGRYDIVIQTDKRYVIIEAKLGFKQHEKQIAKYVKNLSKMKQRKIAICLLDNGSSYSSTWVHDIKKKLPSKISIEFKLWGDVYNRIVEMLKYKKIKSKNETAYFIANELKSYMEVNSMYMSPRKEVHVRDMSGDSIELFFKYKIYKCQSKFYNSAQGSLYFAPYFTSRAPADFEEKSMVRIEKGITWMAPIREIQNVKRSDLRQYLKSKEHLHYKEAADEIFRETKTKEMLVFILGDPFLGFLTPISKKKLGIHGMMGPRNFTFEELFKAAGKGD